MLPQIVLQFVALAKCQVQHFHLRHKHPGENGLLVATQLINRLVVPRDNPLVATNGVCHVQPSARQVLDVFTCLPHKVTFATPTRLTINCPATIIETRNAEPAQFLPSATLCEIR